MPLHLALALVGAVNAAALAAIIGLRAVSFSDQALGRLALLFATFALALFIIILGHGGVFHVGLTATLLELGLTILAGMLLYDYVRSATTKPLPYWAYLLVPVIAAGLILLEGGTMPTLDRLAVTVQMGFTVLAVIHWLRFGGADGERDRLVFSVLVVMTALHVAQALRTVSASSGMFEDVVPLVATGLIAAVIVWLLLRGGLVRRLQARPRNDDAIADDFDRMMEQEKWFLAPSFTLSQAATELGYTPQRVSAALNAHGAGFYERLSRARIVEAKRLLQDPAEARTSIEAIALLAGFKSRSSFYDTFKVATGMTPAAWRQSAR